MNNVLLLGAGMGAAWYFWPDSDSTDPKEFTVSDTSQGDLTMQQMSDTPLPDAGDMLATCAGTFTSPSGFVDMFSANSTCRTSISESKLNEMGQTVLAMRDTGPLKALQDYLTGIGATWSGFTAVAGGEEATEDNFGVSWGFEPCASINAWTPGPNGTALNITKACATAGECAKVDTGEPGFACVVPTAYGHTPDNTAPSYTSGDDGFLGIGGKVDYIQGDVSSKFVADTPDSFSVWVYTEDGLSSWKTDHPDTIDNYTNFSSIKNMAGDSTYAYSYTGGVLNSKSQLTPGVIKADQYLGGSCVGVYNGDTFRGNQLFGALNIPNGTSCVPNQ